MSSFSFAFGSCGDHCLRQRSSKLISARAQTRPQAVIGRIGAHGAGGSQDAKARKHLTFIEYCEPYETVELWFDPGPNDQLELIFLLDFFRSHPEIAARLK